MGAAGRAASVRRRVRLARGPVTIGEPSAFVEPRLAAAEPYRPDTVADGGVAFGLTVRAASVRGLSKRFAGGPRQDDICLRLHAASETLIVAVADGVSGAPRSDLGAALARLQPQYLRQRSQPDRGLGSGFVVSAVVDAARASVERRVLGVEEFGELVPISRFGGQGRVYRPSVVPAGLGSGPVVVKLYRHAPPPGAERVLVEMVAWSHLLDGDLRGVLDRVAAWPLAIVRRGSVAAGIAMGDLSGRFGVPFVMPSGRRERVLLTLEHLLGADSYLLTRGLGIRLDTFTRAEVAERICDALAFLHRHAIVAGDIAPNNLLVAFGAGDEPEVSFIDCDSMVFHGRRALTSVQTCDWDIPAAFGELPGSRAADAYKLGLVVLRLFVRSHDARSHDARAAGPHLRDVPAELHGLLARSLAADAVNRPPAGEWQRALRGLLAEGRLNERYPGPAPARAVVRAAPVARAEALPAAPVPRPTAAGLSQLAGGLWLRRAVVVAWVVAGALVLLLVLSRLFAAAVPAVPSDGGAGFGSQPGSSPYAYPYYPRGRNVPGFVP